MTRQPVITGLGIVSPIGVGTDRFWVSACAGRAGTAAPSIVDASNLPKDCQIVGEVRDFDPREWVSSKVTRMAGRFSQFALAAAAMAYMDSNLAASQLPPERIKVSIGTSMSGLIDVQQPTFAAFLQGDDVWPWTCLEYPAHAATSHVAIQTGAKGQAASFASACAAGLDAIGWAADQIKRGDASAVIAGGTEAPLSQYTLMAFHRVGVLSRWLGPPEEASRPFDLMRAGLVLAEGAAIVILEDEADALRRGAKIYARVLGYASATESEHLRKVDETGNSVSRAMSAALRQSGLAPADIDYVCAHGNSMADYDAAETAGIKSLFGTRAYSIPVSSLKSMCGQALAAASAMQIVASCLTLRDGIIPPTINLHYPDPLCDLDYVPNVARRARVRAIMVHAHSLGGSHAAMVLAAPG